MRRFWVGLASAALLLSIAAPLASAGGANPFNGTWWTNDVDGSRMAVSFAGSGDTRAMSLTDWRATGCDGDRFEAVGTGTISDDSITLDGSGSCADGTLAGPYVMTWSYDAGSNTLVDESGLTWHRQAVSDAFSGVWRSIDVDGSEQQLTLGGSGLDRRVALLDHLATSCEPDALFHAVGEGTIGSTSGEGRLLQATVTGGCANQGQGTYHLEFEYDVLTDTLWDGAVSWFR